jgi:TRAP-type mannitol/chloroaromatic compound transport system permease small subunit
MMIPLGALLILLQGLAKFIRDLTLAITGKEEGA